MKHNETQNKSVFSLFSSLLSLYFVLFMYVLYRFSLTFFHNTQLVPRSWNAYMLFYERKYRPSATPQVPLPPLVSLPRNEVRREEKRREDGRKEREKKGKKYKCEEKERRWESFSFLISFLSYQASKLIPQEIYDSIWQKNLQFSRDKVIKKTNRRKTRKRH